MKKHSDKKVHSAKIVPDINSGAPDVPEAPPASEKRISSAGLHTSEYDRSSYQPNQGLRRSNKAN